MAVVLLALGAGFATNFQSRLSLQLEILALRQQLAIHEPSSGRAFDRETVCFGVGYPVSLGKMAGGSGGRSARDGDRLAAPTVS